MPPKTAVDLHLRDFFKRRIRSGLPSIIKKEIKYKDLMRIRARKQLETAKKKGRVSADIFEIDDEVQVQDAASKKWNKTGRIVEKR